MASQVPQSYILWTIDQAEKDRLSALLDTEFGAFGITSHKVMQPKCACANCGKPSGLDDFVHTALQTGVHSKEWMANKFTGRRFSDGTAHSLQCASCNATFKDPENKDEDFMVRWWVKDW